MLLVVSWGSRLITSMSRIVSSTLENQEIAKLEEIVKLCFDI